MEQAEFPLANAAAEPPAIRTMADTAATSLGDNIKDHELACSTELSTIAAAATMTESSGDEIQDLKFTCFRELPTELRLKIWKHSLPGMRVFSINIRRVLFSWAIFYPSKQILADENEFRVPDQLHTCQEARDVALKSYRVMFEDFGHPFYFNVEVDVLKLDEYLDLVDEWNLTANMEKDFNTVENLVIGEDRRWDLLSPRDKACLIKCLRKFSYLQKLVLKQEARASLNTREWDFAFSMGHQGPDWPVPVRECLAAIWPIFKDESEKSDKPAYSSPRVSIVNAGGVIDLNPMEEISSADT